MRTLANIFPNIDDALSLGPEDMGAVLLELWEGATEDRNDQRVIGTFTANVYNSGNPANYPPLKRRDLELVIAEAWSWLEHEGLIVRLPDSSVSPWFVRTRRGKSLKTRADVESYRQATLLPKDLLHPIISERAWAPFFRGDYDVAVFQAFKSVEVAVREVGKFSNEDFGVPLMRKAFNPRKGPLTDEDKSVGEGERQALCELFAGAIGHAKNPQSHRDKPVKIEEAAQLLLFASYLMTVVDLRRFWV
jgi:uncharacterized protein (TIGR02391 family)